LQLAAVALTAAFKSSSLPVAAAVLSLVTSPKQQTKRNVHKRID